MFSFRTYIHLRSGLPSTDPVFFPTHIPLLDGYQWKKFAGGLHHTLGLTIDGTRPTFNVPL
jgi:alpha-tubulin suppressor-like RCC1 family protein